MDLGADHVSNSPNCAVIEPIAYLNGEYLPISRASLHVFDLGVVGGASVTEMIRTFGHAPFRFEEHLARLERSLVSVGFEPGLTMAELKGIGERVVAENARLIPAQHDLGLIVFVTAGQNLTYLGHAGRDLARKATVCVHTFPLPFELWAEKYQSGMSLVTVPTRSIPDDVLDSKIKHRSRLHWHIAEREARQIDATASAVLTDHEGHLTETAAGNVWFVRGNTLFTPSRHILEGVSRGVVLELASELGLTTTVGDCDAMELAAADEAFVTSTPTCLLPVTKFNGQLIGNGQPGPVFQQLIDRWNGLVGLDIAEQMQRGAADRIA